MKTIPEDENWVIPPENSILVELAAEEQKLLANSQTNYPHCVGKGDHREQLFRNFLVSRLPQNMAACKGHVQDSEGRQTSEFDILLFDPSYRMVIAEAQQDRLVLPVESVIAALEIRTRIDQNAMRNATQKISELSELTRHYRYLDLGDDLDPPPASLGIGAREEGPFQCVLPIPVYLLGFDSTNSASIASDWEKLKNAPDFVMCLGKYVISRPDPDEDSSLIEAPNVGLALLMVYLTGHLLRAKASNAIPDLLRYFLLPEKAEKKAAASK